MWYARSPTHIFPSVSVGAQLGVVYVCVFVRLCAWPRLLAPWKMQCMAPPKSWVTVHPTMEE